MRERSYLMGDRTGKSASMKITDKNADTLRAMHAEVMKAKHRMLYHGFSKPDIIFVGAQHIDLIGSILCGLPIEFHVTLDPYDVLVVNKGDYIAKSKLILPTGVKFTILRDKKE